MQPFSFSVGNNDKMSHMAAQCQGKLKIQTNGLLAAILNSRSYLNYSLT